MPLQLLQRWFQRLDHWRNSLTTDEAPTARRILCTELEDRTLLSAVPIDSAMVGGGGGHVPITPPDTTHTIAPPPASGMNAAAPSALASNIQAHRTTAPLSGGSHELVTPKTTNTNAAKLITRFTTNAENTLQQPTLNVSDAVSNQQAAMSSERLAELKAMASSREQVAIDSALQNLSKLIDSLENRAADHSIDGVVFDAVRDRIQHVADVLTGANDFSAVHFAAPNASGPGRAMIGGNSARIPFSITDTHDVVPELASITR